MQLFYGIVWCYYLLSCVFLVKGALEDLQQQQGENDGTGEVILRAEHANAGKKCGADLLRIRCGAASRCGLPINLRICGLTAEEYVGL